MFAGDNPRTGTRYDHAGGLASGTQRPIIAVIMSVTGLSVCSFCLFLVAYVPLAAGQNGRALAANGSGETDSVELPATWTAKDYKWQVKLPGVGYSSPVALGQPCLRHGGQPRQRQASRLLPQDSATGGVVWHRNFVSKPHPKHDFNSFASCTPVVDQDRLYVVWTTPEHYTVAALREDKPSVKATRPGAVCQPARFRGVAPSSSASCSSCPTTGTAQVRCSPWNGRRARPAGRCRGRASGRASRRRSSSRPTLPSRASSSPIPPHGVSSLNPRTGTLNWEIKVLDWRTTP